MRMIVYFLEYWARPRIVLVAGAAFVVAIWLVNVSGVPGLIESEAVGRVGILDMDYGYTPEQAYDKLVAYGTSGRDAYRQFLVWVDFVYPAIVGIFFYSVVGVALTRAFPERKHIVLLALVPLRLSVFDWFENVAILGMLSAFPEPMPWLARFAALLTMLKAGFGIARIILSIGALYALVWRLMRKRSGRST